MTKVDSPISSAAVLPNPYAVKTRFDSQRLRFDRVAAAVQGAVPVDKLPLAAQESFLLALWDEQFLRALFGQVEVLFRGLNFAEIPTAIVHDEAATYAALGAMSGMFIVGTGNRFGVVEELVIPARIKSIDTQLDVIEKLLLRLEAGVKEFAFTPVAGTAADGSAASSCCGNACTACSGCSCKRYYPGQKLADDDPVIIAFSARRDLPSAGK